METAARRSVRRSAMIRCEVTDSLTPPLNLDTGPLTWKRFFLPGNVCFIFYIYLLSLFLEQHLFVVS